MDLINHVQCTLGRNEDDVKEDEREWLERLKNYISNDHFVDLTTMKFNCKPSKLACSGGIRGVATECRCGEIHEQLEAARKKLFGLQYYKTYNRDLKF